VLKEDRNPERGRSSGIEAARRLRQTLKMLRLFLNRTASGAGSTETAGE
jgi:hypothetical protein